LRAISAKPTPWLIGIHPSNERAVRLWQSCGFAIVGRLPGAFEHPRLGLVDALVMHRML
jgi:ribosomal protein S18 acetylase RimI-like enzyme